MILSMYTTSHKHMLNNQDLCTQDIADDSNKT